MGMRRIFIGDVQGCAAELDALLAAIGLAAGDRVTLVGDLVNRGPDSLGVLRRVSGLGDSAVVVLGNHDLHLLALAHGEAKFKATDAGLDTILEAPDAKPLLDWLQSQPLIHHDATIEATLLHAGLPPQWTIDKARSCAKEVELRLQSEHPGQLFRHMYGDEPAVWQDSLEGWDRLRFTINAFTRLRVCDERDGRMRLEHKGTAETAPRHALPWFRIAWRKSIGARIVFGHWSALGYVQERGVLGLDTGCVWGGSLTGQRIDAPGKPVQVPNQSGGVPLGD